MIVPLIQVTYLVDHFHKLSDVFFKKLQLKDALMKMKVVVFFGYFKIELKIRNQDSRTIIPPAYH